MHRTHNSVKQLIVNLKAILADIPDTDIILTGHIEKPDYEWAVRPTFMNAETLRHLITDVERSEEMSHLAALLED